jgi:hypothetical protein
MKPFLSAMKRFLMLSRKLHSHSACIFDSGGLDAALEGGCLSAAKYDFPGLNIIRKRRRAPLAAALQDLAAIGWKGCPPERVWGNSRSFARD